MIRRMVEASLFFIRRVYRWSRCLSINKDKNQKILWCITLCYKSY
jgi:hypothetical protein